MTFCVENETDKTLPFDAREIALKVINEALDYEECPYEVTVDLILTDDEGIHELNREHRGIDRPTDVLSFPNIEYEEPSNFDGVEESFDDYFDPDSGELVLGDIVVSIDRVYAQASDYGHSPLREFAFLIAHSMLHLLGYDHMEPDEAAVMESKQEEILNRLGITRN